MLVQVEECLAYAVDLRKSKGALVAPSGAGSSSDGPIVGKAKKAKKSTDATVAKTAHILKFFA